jgi:hypothetical protein
VKNEADIGGHGGGAIAAPLSFMPQERSAFANFGPDFNPLRAKEIFEDFWKNAGSESSAKYAAMRVASGLIFSRGLIERVVTECGNEAAADLVNKIFANATVNTVTDAFREGAEAAFKFLGSKASSERRSLVEMYAALSARTTSRTLADLAQKMEPGDNIRYQNRGYRLVNSGDFSAPVPKS